MSADLQKIFSQARELKDEQKKIKKEYKDYLDQDNEYENVMEEIKRLKIKKEQHENSAKDSLGKAWERYEEIQRETAALSEMATDVAINMLADGKKIEVQDEYGNEYEPIYKVNFKKMR